MDWRVAVVDEDRFCIVGTMDLTFDECRALSDPARGGMVRVRCRELLAIGSFEVEPEAQVSAQMVRGQHFFRRSKDGDHRMLHVVVSGDRELDGLRRTGRFREWDADLKATK